MKWYVRGCTVCHGDLHDDMENPGSARCLMCGRSYPIPGATPAPALKVLSLADSDDAESFEPTAPPAPTRLARTA